MKSGKLLARLCVVTLLGGAVASGCGAGATSTSASARLVYVSGATNLGVRTIRADGSGLLVLTTHPPSGELPAWVDRGRAISFSGSDGGLWLMPSSGGAARRVARISDYSTLSPSGRKVAVVAGRLTITDSRGRTLRSVSLKLGGGDGFNSPESSAWSPDERRVAFQVLSSDCIGHIVVVDLVSGRIHTIRARGSIDSDPPAWSPDGGKLAFVATPSPSSSTEDLYVSRADGSERIRLALGVSPVLDNPFAWSPDGRRVAFVRTTGLGAGPHPGSIFVVPAVGGAERRIDRAQSIYQLAWSPDSLRLAVSGEGGIFVARLAGGTKRLTPRGAGYSLSWAPSKRILFADGGAVYSIDGDGGTLRQQLGPALNDRSPVWSPDGRAIAFVRGGTKPDVAGEVWTMTARGRGMRRAGAGYEPSWSPDSRRLAYVRTVEDGPAIVVQRLAGPAKVVAHGTSPSWSPDGTLIAYLEGTTKVRIVSPNGANDRLLLDGTTFEDVNGVAWEHYTAPIVWAPRGNALAVATALLERDGTDHGDFVRVAALSGSSPQTLPLFANSGLDWSPDGKTLAGASEEGISTIAADGTDEQPVVPSTWPLILTHPAWSPDGRELAYNSCRQEDDQEVCGIHVTSADGSTQHRVVRLSAPETSLDFGTSFTPRWAPQPR